MNFPIKEGIETRVTLTGKLDFARAPVLVDALMTLKGKPISTIIFECANLTYISSAGIRAIILAQQKIAPDVTVVIEDVCENVAEALDMCGLSDYIEFTTSSQEVV